MATLSAPLNAEPADPKGRADYGLPPKSFAVAVTEGDNDTASMSPNNGRFSSRASSTTAVESNDGKKEQLDEDMDQDKSIYDKHVGDSGQRLTSVKPDKSYEEALKHNGATAPREKKKPAKAQKRQDPPQAPLESGRKAGAGWQRSAYVHTPISPSGMDFRD